MNSGQDADALAAPAEAAADDAQSGDEAQPGDEAPAAGPAADSGGGAERDQRARVPVWTGAMAVLLALLIAGLAAAVVFLIQVRGFDAAGSRRQAAATAARKAVTDLTTADYQHPQQYVDRLRADATGRFLRLFTNSATGFTNVLVRGKVQTAGRVAEVGVRRISADSAELTVLAYVTVKNSQTPKGAQRVYRLSVSMIPAGSRWLVSNVVFVK